MSEPLKRARLLLVLSFLGLVVAGVSGAAEYVPWLAATCGSFSGGCKETAEFTLFTMPLWLWGAIYYIALAVLLYRAHFLVFWWVALAFGVELSLIWIMVSLHALCIFCLLNCLIVILILVFSFERHRAWQTLAVSLLAFIVAIYIIPKENQSIAAHAERQDPLIVAMIKGRPVTAQELEMSLATELHQLEMQIYARKRDQLDRIIIERLLEEEATKRGVSVQQLVSDKVPVEAIDVTEEEVDRYYQANQSRWADWKGTPEELKTRLRLQLRNEKYRQKIFEYGRSLAAPGEVVVYLNEPAGPLAQLNLQGAYSLGPADAAVTVIEFSDYLCPACRKAHEVTGKVKKRYKDRIKWVFKDFPLRMHKWADKAAEAAHCAGEQGKFWEYQDVLFGSKEELEPPRLKRYAGELGLQVEQFGQCLDSGKYKSAIEADIESARKAGINSTPTFVIDGVPTPGAISLEKFQELLDDALRRAASRKQETREWKPRSG